MPKSIDQQISDCKKQIDKYNKKLKQLEQRKIKMILNKKNIDEIETIKNMVKKGKNKDEIIKRLK